MSGSPWMGVLSIAGFAVATLLLLFLLLTALIIAGSLWAIGAGLYRFLRPRAVLPPLNDQTPSETGIPA